MRASDGLNDKFYTNGAVAGRVVRLIPDIGSYRRIVEPSAGAGAFLPHLPAHARAFDIAPEAPGIIQADWLRVNDVGNGGLLVGNPPFGERSSLARAFIKRGVGQGFDTIAFVLPATFRKLSAQRVFPADWRLVVDEELEEAPFEYGGEPIRIPCVFQVWTRRPGDANLRKHAVPQPEEYEFLTRGHHGADLCLNGNNGRVRSPDTVTNPKAEHYIRVRRGGDTARRLAALPLEFRSSVAGGVAWVSKNEINEAWWRSEQDRLQ